MVQVQQKKPMGFHELSSVSNNPEIK